MTTQRQPTLFAIFAVVLCGSCAFLELYCTQPLLPMLEQVFHASKTAAGMTVSAATFGVALSAPFFGALAERLRRKTVIVASMLGVSIPTLLAATSGSLTQLLIWRFVEGILLPGIFAVVITYIGEEWPRQKVALIMSFYVCGTAFGGFTGRMLSGLAADHWTWRASFLTLGSVGLLGTLAVACWLPQGTHHAPEAHYEPASSHLKQFAEHLTNRRLIATYAVGFNVLFSMVGVFTWITFYLAAPPFNLSTTALSYLFVVYLVGLIATPLAGKWMTLAGLRAGISSAIILGITGVLLTLIPHLGAVIAGLAMLSSSVFIAQTASSTHLREAAPAGSRVSAAGLYLTCYYLGGTAGGVIPGFFWSIGKWPACVAFIIVMQLAALGIALYGWRTVQEKKTALA